MASTATMQQGTTNVRIFFTVLLSLSDNPSPTDNSGEETAATVVGEEEQKRPARVAKGKTAGKPRKKAAGRKPAGRKAAKAKG